MILAQVSKIRDVLVIIVVYGSKCLMGLILSGAEMSNQFSLQSLICSPRPFHTKKT